MRLRAPQTAAVVLGLTLGLGLGAAPACGVGEPPPRPPDPSTAPLRAETAALRFELAALRAQNQRLRWALLMPRRWDEATALEPVGGPGGFQFVALCPFGQAIHGLRGANGALVDSLAVVCAPLDASLGQTAQGGSGPAPLETELDPVGGMGGEAFDRTCPDGMFVSELRGREGETVTQLQPVCHPLDRAETAPSATLRERRLAATGAPGNRTLVRIGGSEGTPFTRECPEGEVGVGLTGHSGNVIDSVTLHCAPPPTGAASAAP